MAVPKASPATLAALVLLNRCGLAAGADQAPQARRFEISSDAHMIQTNVLDVLYVSSKAAKTVTWTLHTKKHCYWQRMRDEPFSSLADAKAKCSSLSTCFGVYDQGCDESAEDVHLCDGSLLTHSSMLDPSFDSCVYEKVIVTPPPPPTITHSLQPPQKLSATGDPHLVNMYGERFDIFQEGTHVLLQIPKGTWTKKAFLHVVAEAQHSGPACSDLYFTALNVTGQWAEPVHRGGLQYFASKPPNGGHSNWTRFRSVDLKVRWGHTGEGTQYLNLFIRHLSRTGYKVGGLLGEDDHSKAALRSQLCARTVSLLQIQEPGKSNESLVALASVAQADLM